ncbi:MAG: hypothetical protein PHY16_17525 [Methylobacter sp.]|nr:hypothetical protein [Methylobacter sp.]
MNLIILLLVVAIFSLFIHLRSGNYPDWQTLFKYQKTFYISGFGMMSMPLFHIWNIIILMYIVGLFISIRAVLEKENTYQDRMIFLLSILGVGIFSYYQGRSHDVVLTIVAYPAILLWAIFADRLLLNWKAGRLLYPGKIYLLVIMSIFIVALSVLLFSGKSLLIIKQARRGFDSFTTRYPITALKENIDFIRSNTVFGEKAFIICEPHFDGIYYGNTGLRNPANIPGSTELLLANDFEKEILFLSKHNEFKLFVDFAFAPQELIRVINENYTIIGKSQSGMHYLRWNERTLR